MHPDKKKTMTRAQAEKLLSRHYAEGDAFVNHPNYHVRRKAWRKAGGHVPADTMEVEALIKSIAPNLISYNDRERVNELWRGFHFLMDYALEAQSMREAHEQKAGQDVALTTDAVDEMLGVDSQVNANIDHEDRAMEAAEMRAEQAATE